MKLYKTLLFIFGILILLTGLCLFFPKDGIQIGSLNLRFPSIHEVLNLGNNEEEEVHELTPEELLEQRMAQLMQVQDSTFLDFCHNSPIRIVMPKIHIQVVDSVATDSLRKLALEYDPATPDSLLAEIVTYRDSITDEGDLSYFDPLFVALDSARQHHVRILHYGDSQIEEDRITAALREHFQEEFGGGGVGMMPAIRTVYKMTISQSSSQNLGYYLAYGPVDGRASHNGYGPMAQVSHLNGTVTLSYNPVNNEQFSHVNDFNRVTVLRSDGNSHDLVMDVTDYDSIIHNAKVTVEGPTKIYGVMLDQRTGVSMDNVSMRGCSGSIFTKITRSTLEPFFQHENVQLIILQYGGNSVPYLKTEDSQIRYCKDMQKQISYFKELAPDARILFIGPSDMATTINGVRSTYPQIPPFVKLLEKYVTEAGAAFWNMFEAMGGQGSMVQWVASRPQLAGEDYIHFTRKGAQYVSDLLYETIDTYYKYYKFRIGEYEIEMPADSISADSLMIDSLTSNSIQP